ncbi:MAG: hypothetical protein ACOYKJ_04720 [Candidatus Howiella sp.]|jgi:hypothetical protein
MGENKRLCLLAIGNSFSEDATHWLCELALDAGGKGGFCRGTRCGQTGCFGG